MDEFIYAGSPWTSPLGLASNLESAVNQPIILFTF